MTSDSWGDGDVVHVAWVDENGGYATWTGQIVGERMGEGGTKPHRIEGAVIRVIVPAPPGPT